MWEWITWGFVLGVKVFGAAAGLCLALVVVFLLSIITLAELLEIVSNIALWAANIIERLLRRTVQ